MITYKSKYINFVFILLVFIFLLNIIGFYLYNDSLKYLLQFLISGFVMFAILKKYRWVKTVVKIWAFILITGGGLIVLSQILYLLANANEKMSIPYVLFGGVQLICGVIIFLYCDDSINVET